MLKKFFKITLKVVEWLVFAVVVSVFFVSFSPLLPFKNMPKTYVVATGSMIPTIMPGSVSIVLPIAPEKLQPKDIIAFKSSDNPKNTILHRIDSIKSTEPLIFKTKGDNNNAPDNWDVPAMDVGGKYLISVPLFGHVAAFMKKPLGFALMVIAPALIFIIFQIFNIKKAINEEVERRVKKEAEKSNKSVTQTIRSVIVLISIISFSSLVCTREILAFFSDTVDVNNLSISVKDFVPPPVPTLNSPANDALLNTTGLVMGWNAVTDFEDMHNPVYYYYQSARNEGFSPLAYTSGKLTNPFIPAPGTPDGTYWWRVRACDAIDNCSDWSTPWKVTIDNIAPVVNFTNIVNNQVIHGSKEIRGSVNDLHPDHYWFVIQNSGGSTVAGPGTVNDDTSFTNKKLIDWDTTAVSDGKYTAKLEARDAANNKSGTASVKWLTIWVENDADVEVLTPTVGAIYHLGDTVPVTWHVSNYSAPGDLYSTVWVSTNSGTDYTIKIAENLKNTYNFNWVIPNDATYKTLTMKIKVIVKNDYDTEFYGESAIFDPIEEKAEDKKDDDKKDQKDTESQEQESGESQVVEETETLSTSDTNASEKSEEPKNTQETKDESKNDTSDSGSSGIGE